MCIISLQLYGEHYNKLKEVHDGLTNMNVVNFPVITLEELTAMVHSDFFWLTNFEPLSLLLHGGKYLRERCLHLRVKCI